MHLSAESESVNSGKHPWEQEQTDGITHIITEAIRYQGHYYRYHNGGHYYRHRSGLSVSMGGQGITAIGKRITVRTALTIL